MQYVRRRPFHIESDKINPGHAFHEVLDMNRLVSSESLVDINDAWREYTAARTAEFEAANRVVLEAGRRGIQHPVRNPYFLGAPAIAMSWYTARGDRPSVVHDAEHQLMTMSGRKILVRALFRSERMMVSRRFDPGRPLYWSGISRRNKDGVIRLIDADAVAVVGFDRANPVHIAEFRVDGCHNWPGVGRGKMYFHDLIATQESDGCVAEQISDDSDFWVR